MKYIYLLTITAEETGETLGHLEAYTEESLLEQMRKIDAMKDTYERKTMKLSNCCDAPVSLDGAFCSACNECIKNK